MLNSSVSQLNDLLMELERLIAKSRLLISLPVV